MAGSGGPKCTFLRLERDVFDALFSRWVINQYQKSGIRCKDHIKVVIKLWKAKKKKKIRSDVKKCDILELELEISLYFFYKEAIVSDDIIILSFSSKTQNNSRKNVCIPALCR